MRKVLAVGIIILFLLVGIYPTSAIDSVKKSIIHLIVGIFYMLVGVALGIIQGFKMQ